MFEYSALILPRVRKWELFEIDKYEKAYYNHPKRTQERTTAGDESIIVRYCVLVKGILLRDDHPGGYIRPYGVIPSGVEGSPLMEWVRRGGVIPLPGGAEVT